MFLRNVVVSFLVPQKVRFIATALLKQVWRCALGRII